MNSENLNESIGNIADKYINEALDGERKRSVIRRYAKRGCIAVVSFVLMFLSVYQYASDWDVDRVYGNVLCVRGKNLLISDNYEVLLINENEEELEYICTFDVDAFEKDECVYSVYQGQLVLVNSDMNGLIEASLELPEGVSISKLLCTTEDYMLINSAIYGSYSTKIFLYNAERKEVLEFVDGADSKGLLFYFHINENILLCCATDRKITKDVSSLYHASLINLDNNVRVPLGEINPNGCYFDGAFYYPVEGNVVGRVELPKELFEDMTQTMTLEEIQALEERIVPAEAEMIEIPGIEGEQRVKKLYQVDEERIAVVTESVASQEGSELRNELYIYRVGAAETEKLFECAGSINDLAYNGESVVFIYDENGAEESSYEILEIGR